MYNNKHYCRHFSVLIFICAALTVSAFFAIIAVPAEGNMLEPRCKAALTPSETSGNAPLAVKATVALIDPRDCGPMDLNFGDGSDMVDIPLSDLKKHPVTLAPHTYRYGGHFSMDVEGGEAHAVATISGPPMPEKAAGILRLSHSGPGVVTFSYTVDVISTNSVTIDFGDSSSEILYASSTRFCTHNKTCYGGYHNYKTPGEYNVKILVNACRGKQPPVNDCENLVSVAAKESIHIAGQ